MNLEWKELVVDRLVEAKASDHRTEVATSADERRDDRKVLLVHEGHDAVAGTLCHLHKEREAQQHHQGHIPWLVVAYGPEGEEEDGLEEKCEELRPDAATEA